MIILFTVEACSILPFGKSNPSARNPGSISTTTNLDYFSDAYAEEEEEGFVVAGFGGQTPGPTKFLFKVGELFWVQMKKMFFIHTTT